MVGWGSSRGFVEGGGSGWRQGIDAGVLGGDLLRCGWAAAEEEGKGFGGFGVGEHESDADGDFANRVAVHPGDAAFELFQLCKRLL
jgi:hypothetical protein